MRPHAKSAVGDFDASAIQPLTIEQEIAEGRLPSIVRLVDLLVESAQKARASDVHLEPRVDGVAVRMRIDGVLEDLHLLSISVHQEIISRIKVLSGLRIDEHQSPQDGRFCANLESGVPIDVRVSIVPTYYGENAVLRLLSDTAEDFSLKALGFTRKNQEKILRALAKPHGMILATGPTGSGKTTTLYTLTKLLNTPQRSIITIEDPIEYSIAGITQIQINPRTGLTFGNGLRSILRQDPEVIMVGEIRDNETAGLAVNTALTGHLVLSTLHTNDAPTTLPRLLDMHVESYLISSTVSLVIGQRLVRRICDGCKEQQEMDDTLVESIRDVLPPEFSGMPFYKGRGCSECAQSGYHGRIGLHEVIEIDQIIRNAILSKKSIDEIRDVAIAQGMTPLMIDGFKKAARGLTSLQEVLRMRYE